MEEEKLVHPIVTARTLPHGDSKETNTCGIKKKKKIQIHILILSSFYLNTDVFTPVSVTLYENARLDFFPQH